MAVLPSTSQRLLAELTPVQGLHLPHVSRINKNEAGLVIHFLDVIVNTLFDPIKKGADEFLKEPSNSSGFYVIDLKKLEENFKLLEEDLGFPTAIAHEECGLTDSELLSCAKKAKELAIRCFSISRTKVPYHDLPQEFKTWQTIALKVRREYRQTVQAIYRRESPYEVSTCVLYAFYVLQEPLELLPNSFLGEGYLEALNIKGFKNVETPKKNDLIVYLKQAEGGCLEAKHYGVVQENGKILSQLGGTGDLAVFEHPINITDFMYGNTVAFFRKSLVEKLTPLTRSEPYLYQTKMNIIGVQCDLFEKALHEIFRQKSEQLLTVYEKDKDPKKLFKLNFERVLSEVCDTYRQNLTPALFEEKYGLNDRDRQDNLDILKERLSESLKTVNIKIYGRDVQNIPSLWEKEVTLQLNKLWQSLGGANLGKVSSKRTDSLSCIFKKFKDQASSDLPIDLFYSEHYLENLTRQGYENVQEPKEGDMVVYLDDQRGASELKATHFGFISERQRVISRLRASFDPTLFEHEVNTVPLSYGNKVAFFRIMSILDGLHLRGSSLPIYRIEKNVVGSTSSYYRALIETILNQQFKEIKDLYEKNPDPSRVFNVSFEKRVEETYKALNLKQDPQSKIDGERCGLSEKEHENCFANAKILVRTCLSEVDKIIPGGELDLAVKKWTETSFKVLKGYWLSMGDLERGLSDSATNCVTWTFQQLQDQNCLKLDPSKYFLNSGYEKTLKVFGYTPILEPKEGDMIIYLDDRKDPLAPIATHYGIVQANRRILSKKGGVLDPHIYEHAVNTTSFSYGNLVVFYRKSTKL